MIDWRKTMKVRKLFFVFFFNIHVHLFICLCQVWYSSSLQYTVVASCGIQFSDQDPTQGPLHCRPGVLTLWTTRESQRDESFLETLGILCMRRVSQVAIVVKNAPANAGDLRVPDSIQGQENPGGGHGNPLWYSCLENPMDSGALAVYSPLACKESDMTEVT